MSRDLAPLATAPDRQRRCIGGALMRAAFAEAGDAGCGLLVLLGEPVLDGRIGLAPAAEPGLRSIDPAGVLLALGPGEAAVPGGSVPHDPAFDAL